MKVDAFLVSKVQKLIGLHLRHIYESICVKVYVRSKAD